MPILSREEVLLLHEDALLRHGGMFGIRDPGLLDSALAQPSMTFGGRDLYPSEFDKAAALAVSLVLNHPFVAADRCSERSGGSADGS